MTSRATRSFGAIDPSSYLTLAIELATFQAAAAHRTAVDRAYYAAFLTARDQLTDKGYGRFTREAGVHTQVASVLNGVSKDVAERLIRLRRARNRLTYQPGSQTLPRGQSLAALPASARSVIEAVEELPTRG